MNRDENSPNRVRGRLVAQITRAKSDLEGASRLLNKFDPAAPKLYQGQRSRETLIRNLEAARAYLADRRKALEQHDAESRLPPVCTCYWCGQRKPHPERHTSWHSISAHLLVAESLDPNDWIPMKACLTCGHKEPGPF